MSIRSQTGIAALAACRGNSGAGQSGGLRLARIAYRTVADHIVATNRLQLSDAECGYSLMRRANMFMRTVSGSVYVAKSFVILMAMVHALSFLDV